MSTSMPRGVVFLCMGWLLAAGSAVRCQDAADVRAMLERRVGDLSVLQVPENVADFPQPRLPSGEIDPRFAVTPEKAYLGRFLFFDPIRSTHIDTAFGGMVDTTQTASCGSCHLGEAASKAAAVIAVGVGGEGRHEMDTRGHMTITRQVREGLVDILPTPMEMVDEAGDVVESGRFDSIDSPPRVSPSVIGFAFNNRLLWAGEAGEPNPEEYPAQEDIVRKASEAHRMANPDTSHLQANPVYVRLFERAFPDEHAAAQTSGDLGDLISVDTQFRAIAAFLRTVITRDTPWDRFLAGDDDAMTPQQLRGAWLFATPPGLGGANCIACHSGPALNKQVGDEAGIDVEENFANLGLQEHPLHDLARETLGNPDHHDFGRWGVTGSPDDLYEFKSPTLRQMKDAAPFFHSGEAATLRDVVEYFNAGVASNPAAEAAGNMPSLFTQPRGASQPGLGLSEDDIDALIAFLEDGLYDEGFVNGTPDSATPMFELDKDDLTYSQELRDLGASDGWLPSSLPNGFNDEMSRDQILFVRGEVNGDGEIDLSDPVTIVRYLFNGDATLDSMVAGDVNDDSRIDVADTVYLLAWLFRGGPEPPYPFHERGQDLTR